MHGSVHAEEGGRRCSRLGAPSGRDTAHAERGSPIPVSSGALCAEGAGERHAAAVRRSHGPGDSGLDTDRESSGYAGARFGGGEGIAGSPVRAGQTAWGAARRLDALSRLFPPSRRARRCPAIPSCGACSPPPHRNHDELVHDVDGPARGSGARAQPEAVRQRAGDDRLDAAHPPQHGHARDPHAGVREGRDLQSRAAR